MISLFLHGEPLGSLPTPARLFVSNLVYVCPRCGVAWGRVEALKDEDYFPVGRSCLDCPPSPSPRHVPGSFFQYYTDFNREYLDHWLKAIEVGSSEILAWEFARHLGAVRED